MCSHILYSYSEQGPVPRVGRRGIESTVYRTHTKQMLLHSAIDLSKWYMSNIDDTIRMSRLSLASLEKEMGMPSPSPINTDSVPITAPVPQDNKLTHLNPPALGIHNWERSKTQVSWMWNGNGPYGGKWGQTPALALSHHFDQHWFPMRPSAVWGNLFGFLPLDVFMWSLFPTPVIVMEL